MKHLVIIGAGELGREMYWNIKDSIGFSTDYDIKGYIDDAFGVDNKEFNLLQVPLISKISDYSVQDDDVFISAIGSVDSRKKTVDIIKSKGGEFISIINKTSIIHGTVKIGEGVFLGPYTVIGDNATINDHVFLNTHSAIGHDAVIGKYTCIMSYVDITGCCNIGEKVYLASGCRMTPSSKIGDNAYVGIGSVVLRRVKAGKKVFGNPAKEYSI